MKIYIGLMYILFEATKTLNTKNILMLTEIYIYFQSIINLKIQKKKKETLKSFCLYLHRLCNKTMWIIK